MLLARWECKSHNTAVVINCRNLHRRINGILSFFKRFSSTFTSHHNGMNSRCARLLIFTCCSQSNCNRLSMLNHKNIALLYLTQIMYRFSNVHLSQITIRIF
ncbi:DUF2034 domain-containing protein [Polynucleobacter asymbioticus]|nr:DUF2034 domain-containing protein [Polynucleobacter asymbioticus]